MNRILVYALLALAASGCGNLPGLRVLTGQEDAQGDIARVVETLDLVMADKTGSADPALIALADRIESAAGNVDIIEIRQDDAEDVFVVNMLLTLPTDASTLEGRVANLDAFRRALELTWQGALQLSLGSDTIRIAIIDPRPLPTLDNGTSFYGGVMVNAEISREDAALYLTGERSLPNFYNLILDGVLDYQNPESFQIYEGTPNHPMFMLPVLADEQSG